MVELGLDKVYINQIISPVAAGLSYAPWFNYYFILSFSKVNQ